MRSLPPDVYGVASEGSIVANDRCSLSDRLGNEQAIERIAVMRRQSIEGKNVRQAWQWA